MLDGQNVYKVQIAVSAIRDLDDIYDPDLSRIRSRIFALEENPRPPGVKKLKGSLHRLRAGDWRVLYAIEDMAKKVVVLHVLRRSERTYKNL